MKEYLIINLILTIVMYLLDRVFNTGLFNNKKFWYFHLIIIILTTLVDNYSSGRPIVLFNENFITGVRIIHVPMENYLFGFNLLTFNLILYERAVKKY